MSNSSILKRSCVICTPKSVSRESQLRNNWDKRYFLREAAYYGKGSTSTFEEIFASTDKNSIFRGRLSKHYVIILWRSEAARQLVRQLVYLSLLLIIMLPFTCFERKVCSTIKNSQNIVNMFVWKMLFCVLFIY